MGNIVRAYEHAAERGQVEAQFDLGLMYATGHGVRQDFVVAHKWFNLAAAHGNGEARAHRLDLARDMSVAEVTLAQRLAREWRCGD